MSYSQIMPQFLSLSRADYQLQVIVVNYANPSSRRSNGDCCDFSILCSNDCDTHLEFCFRPPGYSDSVNEDCPLGSLTAGPVGGDSITFGSSVGSLPNPFTVQVEESWLVSFTSFKKLLFRLIILLTHLARACMELCMESIQESKC